MKKYKHLLFDLDHTLWDFERNSRDTLEELFLEFGIKDYYIDFQDFHDNYSINNSSLWNEYGRGMISKDEVKYNRFILCLAKAGFNKRDVAMNMADEYVKRSPCKTHLVEGALELLQALSGRYSMHIITNGFNEVQHRKLGMSGLSPYFDNIFTSEDAGYQKPDPGFFDFVFNTNGMRIFESLVIGDNLQTDIKGAKNYGIDTIFFNPDEKQDTAGATYVVSKLGEIQGLLL